MRISPEDTTDFQLFVEIVQAGNLSAAARALDSSPAAMSRRLGALESRLGVRLVTRNSRSFSLTDEGQLFLDRCLRIVSDIAEAEAEVSSKGGSVKGSLRIGAPMALGRKLISPLLCRFVERYPGTQIHLKLSDKGLDLFDEGLDVVLRIGLPSETSVIARRILTTRRIVCASPSYLKRQGTPKTPEDLQHHNCIRLVRGRRVMDKWRFQDNGSPYEVPVDGTLTTTSGEVLHDWVRGGMGIGLKASWDIQPDLANGNLVQCLEDYWCDEISLYAICAERRYLPPRIRAFLDFIAKALPAEIEKSQPRK